jgi:hypothetical protein
MPVSEGDMSVLMPSPSVQAVPFVSDIGSASAARIDMLVAESSKSVIFALQDLSLTINRHDQAQLHGEI